MNILLKSKIFLAIGVLPVLAFAFFIVPASAQNQVVQLDPQGDEDATNASVSVAQIEPPFTSPIDYTGDNLVDSMISRIEIVRPEVNPNNIPSLFFSPSEQSLLQEARLGLMTRAPTDGELAAAENGEIPPGPRELTLGGIVYASKGDWTIWLNGQEITPERIPPEILDIQVQKKAIKIKWFDAYTNQIFPIKLRSQQRFNIDSKIFLPG